jgi:hypothetical protein
LKSSFFLDKQNESNNNETSPLQAGHMSRNIKYTIATLEAELEKWKLKYAKLQVGTRKRSFVCKNVSRRELLKLTLLCISKGNV